MKNTALNFTYGNQSSMAFGVTKINLNDSVLQEETILPGRTIKAEMRRFSETMDLYSIEFEEPLSFEMELLLDDSFDRNSLRGIVRWLKRNTYLPLIFDTMPDTVFYAIMSSDFVIHHNLRNQGYLRVAVSCNAPYGFTLVQSSPIYINSGTTDVALSANTDFDTLLVKTLIKKVGDGDLLIKNMSNQTEFNLVGLLNGDQIILDSYNHIMSASDINDNEIIINDKKINHSWVTFWTDNNSIRLTGDAEIQFLWQGIKVV